MEEIIFGGAVLSMIIVAVTFIVSLSLFIWKWLSDDFKRGYKDAMESE
ncbi:MAG: hypothetical protein QF380_03185 [Candidatus Marinimicrobia bacterium]|jgi:hypothetical protein|nr:hypothetical protein [Candidatus Neomarinimicrobiota bacterium]